MGNKEQIADPSQTGTEQQAGLVAQLGSPCSRCLSPPLALVHVVWGAGHLSADKQQPGFALSALVIWQIALCGVSRKAGACLPGWGKGSALAEGGRQAGLAQAVRRCLCRGLAAAGCCHWPVTKLQSGVGVSLGQVPGYRQEASSGVRDEPRSGDGIWGPQQGKGWRGSKRTVCVCSDSSLGWLPGL